MEEIPKIFQVFKVHESRAVKHNIHWFLDTTEVCLMLQESSSFQDDFGLVLYEKIDLIGRYLLFFWLRSLALPTMINRYMALFLNF